MSVLYSFQLSDVWKYNLDKFNILEESIFLPNFDFVKHLLVELDFSSSNDWLIELTYILNMNDKILEMLETNENKNAMEEILIYSIQKSVLWIFYWL
jgi:hypothetical protein